MSTKQDWPSWAKVALGIVIAGLLAVIVAMAIAAFATEDAEAAAWVTPTQAEQYKAIAAASTGAGSFEVDGTYSKAGGIKCKTVRNVDTWGGSFRILKQVLTTNWCWNGNRITEISNYSSCQVTGLGDTIGMEYDECGKSGFYKPFQGNSHGAYEARQHYSTRQVLCAPVVGCWTTPAGNKDGKNVTVVFANGGYQRFS